MTVRNILVQFLDAYLVRRELETALAFLSDDIISLGTGVQEVALNKEELRELMLSEFEGIPNGFRYEFEQYREYRYTDDVYGTFGNVLVSMRDESGLNLYLKTRLTSTIVRLGDEWRIVSLHMSAPSEQQTEEEFFPIKYSRQAVGRLDASASKKLADIMLSILPGGIMGGYLEEGFPLYIINDGMLDCLGYTYDELIEETDGKMRKMIDPEDQERVEETIYKSIRETGEYNVQYRVIRKDGTKLWINDKGHEITTEDGKKAMISIMLDITDSIQLQESLRREAMEDPLTGIFNRKGAIARIEEYLEKRQPCTIMLMDIDNFKQLNDTYGHQAGDQVLAAFGEILLHNAGAEDVAARIGGDEFLLFIPDAVPEAALQERAEAIGSLFGRFGKDTGGMELSVSTGVAVSRGETNFDRLFKRADDLLYQVKKTGKGGIETSRQEDQ